MTNARIAQPGSSGAAPQGEPRGSSTPAVLGLALGAGLFVILTLAVRLSVSHATERLTTPEPEKLKVAIAQQAEVGYCTAAFKTVLERVLHSCGLAKGEDRRGCKPTDVKTFASISDEDFNALFTPLRDRGAVLRFDMGSHELDEASKKVLEERFFDRKGARYFFVVARASKTGTAANNRALSHRRANSVLYHLKQVSNDPELDNMVGLLWLGNEYAQLSKDYCSWPNSRPGEKCDDEPINRSAFISWVDCRL